MIILGLTAGASVLIAVPAHAATTYEVNSSADLPDANPADGECRTSAGTCTLRVLLRPLSLQSREQRFRWVGG